MVTTTHTQFYKQFPLNSGETFFIRLNQSSTERDQHIKPLGTSSISSCWVPFYDLINNEIFENRGSLILSSLLKSHSVSA